MRIAEFSEKMIAAWQPAIDVVIDSVFLRVPEDPRLSTLYANIDTGRMKQVYKDYFCEKSGTLKPITLKHVSRHLHNVLSDFQVEDDMINSAPDIMLSA